MLFFYQLIMNFDANLDILTRKVLKDVQKASEKEFNDPDNKNSFFINIEFKTTKEGREIGHVVMPSTSVEKLKEYIKIALDLLDSTKRKLDKTS
jgi:hypothetical protein